MSYPSRTDTKRRLQKPVATGKSEAGSRSRMGAGGDLTAAFGGAPPSNDLELGNVLVLFFALLCFLGIAGAQRALGKHRRGELSQEWCLRCLSSRGIRPGPDTSQVPGLSAGWVVQSREGSETTSSCSQPGLILGPWNGFLITPFPGSTHPPAPKILTQLFGGILGMVL